MCMSFAAAVLEGIDAGKALKAVIDAGDSELLESLRSKPVPVPVRIGTKDYRAKSTCKQLHPLDVKAITAKLAFTKE